MTKRIMTIIAITSFSWTILTYLVGWYVWWEERRGGEEDVRLVDGRMGGFDGA
jgi:hypothetical protein